MPNTPQPPEDIESVMREIIAKKMQKFQEAVQRFYKGEVTSRYLDDIFNDFLFSTYAEGRSSMKRDIEAVVPLHLQCEEHVANNVLCGSCKECWAWNACRSQLLDNMKGIV